MHSDSFLMRIWLLSILALSPCLGWSTILPPVPDDRRCKNWGEAPNDGPLAYSNFVAQVAINFKRNDKTLAHLESDANEWNTPGCVFDDGEPVISSLTKGFDSVFTRGKDWSESLARVQLVRTKFPDAPFAALAEAVYWRNYAWHGRGGGFANGVTQEGWKLFRERLEKAEKVLIDSKPYAAELPNWYAEMIAVQGALERPAIDRANIFLEGAQKYKTYYPIYHSMLHFFTPYWGGSWEEVDKLIIWSVENAHESVGNSMYARLYSSVFSKLPKEVSFFKDTRVSWPKMKLGFEDMMTKYPKSKWNLNNFAMFACMAEDKDTFLTLRNKIGADIMPEAWQRVPLELCEIKAGYAQ